MTTFSSARRSLTAIRYADFQSIASMKNHPAYTELAWQADEVRRRAGQRWECPDCASEFDYGPTSHSRSDGSARHYRACKNCGFWQEADGSPPYRIWLAVHDCSLRIAPRQLVLECSTCGNSSVVPAGSTEWKHRCGKYLKPWEDGFQCSNCHTFKGRESEQALLSRGSDS
jgi:RNase P subunit RPR2